MNNELLESILACIVLENEDSSIQRVQTEHRIKLAQFWGIKAGSRVLEIGCGQGDTQSIK